MNSDQLKGKWRQLRGSAKEQWGKLTDDDLEQIAGKTDQLVGKLQERYGIAREEAQKRADDWLKMQKESQGLSDEGSNQTARREMHHTAKR